jgi:hypothetical protein
MKKKGGLTGEKAIPQEYDTVNAGIYKKKAVRKDSKTDRNCDPTTTQIGKYMKSAWKLPDRNKLKNFSSQC